MFFFLIDYWFDIPKNSSQLSFQNTNVYMQSKPFFKYIHQPTSNPVGPRQPLIKREQSHGDMAEKKESENMIFYCSH